MNGDDSYALKKRVTLIGAFANVLLSAGKIVAGVIGQSQALVADGVHSLSDLVSDAVVLGAARIGRRGPDHDHPYGHARFETAATVGIGLLLLAVGGGFIFDAVQRLLDQSRLLEPGWLALSVALGSVVVKEWLYHYTARAARIARSGLIEANAWHHRSDALSSAVVIGGIGGAMAGVPWLDAVAAIIVAVMIGLMGWQFVWQSMQELVDRGLEPEQLAELEKTIGGVEGVRSWHQLRTRRVGADVLADMHVTVDSRATVSEAHRIGEEVQARLQTHMPDLAQVLVHVDHESPTAAAATRTLPLRGEVLVALNKAWARISEAQGWQVINLHYRNGRLSVDVVLPRSVMVDPAALEARLQAAAASELPLEEVRVLLR
jgi:cation diffusion facilitator family transporter